ncbi:unnamed protein product [Amoebophrya sp. A25]|nr:unnamed protein product [Amoebophrya sp. A25]|eukprot:GSA25T00011945001.1
MPVVAAVPFDGSRTSAGSGCLLLQPPACFQDPWSALKPGTTTANNKAKPLKGTSSSFGTSSCSGRKKRLLSLLEKCESLLELNEKDFGDEKSTRIDAVASELLEALDVEEGGKQGGGGENEDLQYAGKQEKSQDNSDTTSTATSSSKHQQSGTTLPAQHHVPSSSNGSNLGLNLINHDHEDDQQAAREEVDMIRFLRGLVFSVTSPDTAVHLLEQCLQMNPFSQQAWNTLGTLYFDRENFESAIGCFQNSLDFTGENATACRCLSIAMRKSDRAGDGSLDWARRAIHLEPEEVLNWECLGNYFFYMTSASRSALEEAYEIYTKATELDAKNANRSPTLWHNIGAVQLCLLCLGEAYESLEICASLKSEQHQALAKRQMKQITDVVKNLDDSMGKKCDDGNLPVRWRSMRKKIDATVKQLVDHTGKKATFGGWAECIAPLIVASDACGAESDETGQQASEGPQGKTEGKRQVVVVDNKKKNKQSVVIARAMVALTEIQVPIPLVCMDQNHDFFVVAVGGTDRTALEKKLHEAEQRGGILEIRDWEVQPLTYKRKEAVATGVREWRCIRVDDPKCLTLDGQNLGNLAVVSTQF